MDNNYITRYTLTPIYEHNGWTNNIKQEENIMMYIVTKCNVVKGITSQLTEEKKIYFKTYDEALKEKERLNIEILNKQIELLQLNQNYEVNKQYLIQEHQKNLQQYQKVENLIQVEVKPKTLTKKIIR